MKARGEERENHMRRGYTLVELLIVITLLGISASLLVPHLVGRDSMQVQAAVRMVIGDMNFAQSDALAHQELRRVHFYPDGSGYALIRIASSDLSTIELPDDPDYLEDPAGSQGQYGRYIVNFETDSRFAGVRIVAAEIDNVPLSPSGTNINYDEMGGTVRSGGDGTGGFIDVSSGDETYRITITPFTGKLSVASVP